jgi:signal recognition particle GTPase
VINSPPALHDESAPVSQSIGGNQRISERSVAGALKDVKRALIDSVNCDYLALNFARLGKSA